MEISVLSLSWWAYDAERMRIGVEDPSILASFSSILNVEGRVLEVSQQSIMASDSWLIRPHLQLDEKSTFHHLGEHKALLYIALTTPLWAVYIDD
jgi:hypothetical protein